MKTQNNFTVNYNKKELILNYEGEEFKWDLNEGDIGDFWHSFTNQAGVTKDINFHQEDETQEPSLAVYGLTYNEKEKNYLINTSDEDVVPVLEKIGDPKNYFNYGEVRTPQIKEKKSCTNCGSTNGYNNSSDEFQCNNCGHSETE